MSQIILDVSHIDRNFTYIVWFHHSVSVCHILFGGGGGRVTVSLTGPLL